MSNLYEFEVRSKPSQREIAECPEPVLGMVKQYSIGNRKAEPVGDVIARGARNSTLLSIGGTLRNRGLSHSVILPSLQSANTELCEPPLEDEEIKRIARSVCKYEAGLLSDNGQEPVVKTTIDLDETDYLLSETADHEGHAQCLHRLYENEFLYCPEWGWLYDAGTHWERDKAEARLHRAAIDTLITRRIAAVKADREAVVKATKGTRHNLTGTIGLYRSLITVSITEFDDAPDLLNTKNGVLHLRSRKLLTEDPGQRFSYCLPVAWIPEAAGSNGGLVWRKFLLGTVAGAIDVADYLQMAAGYSLTGHTWEEILFYIYGPTRSGKGTYAETMMAMMGRPLAASLEFQSLTAPRYGDVQNFDLAGLRSSRLVVASESNKYQPLNPAKIKQITGGDYIRAAFKHKDMFSYRPQFKLWLLSNHPVNIDVSDDAAWARVKVIHFPTSHLGNEDKQLKHELRKTKALEAVLAWAAEGARLWYASDKGLIAPKPIVEMTKKQREAQDFVQQFIEECCTQKESSWTASSLLYQEYSEWCKDNGVTAKKIRQFGAALSGKGFESARKKSGGKTRRGFMGVELI